MSCEVAGAGVRMDGNREPNASEAVSDGEERARRYPFADNRDGDGRGREGDGKVTVGDGKVTGR